MCSAKRNTLKSNVIQSYEQNQAASPKAILGVFFGNGNLLGLLFLKVARMVAAEGKM